METSAVEVSSTLQLPTTTIQLGTLSTVVPSTFLSTLKQDPTFFVIYFSASEVIMNNVNTIDLHQHDERSSEASTVAGTTLTAIIEEIVSTDLTTTTSSSSAAMIIILFLEKQILYTFSIFWYMSWDILFFRV